MFIFFYLCILILISLLSSLSSRGVPSDPPILSDDARERRNTTQLGRSVRVPRLNPATRCKVPTRGSMRRVDGVEECAVSSRPRLPTVCGARGGELQATGIYSTAGRETAALPASPSPAPVAWGSSRRWGSSTMGVSCGNFDNGRRNKIIKHI